MVLFQLLLLFTTLFYPRLSASRALPCPAAGPAMLPRSQAAVGVVGDALT